jgi:proton glutamate symport protein
LALHWQILIALVMAAAVGLVGDAESQLLGVNLAKLVGFFGDWFLRALKMLIVPLIVSSIIMGVTSVGGGRALGRLGAKTAGYYVATSILAILTGLAMVALLTPGVVDGEPVKDRIGLKGDVSAIGEKVKGRDAGDIVGVFLRMVPANVFKDAAEGQMLGLIFFSILFGALINHLGDESARAQKHFWGGVNEIMMKMTEWVMLFAPIGVFGLVCPVLLTTNDFKTTFLALLSFVATVLSALSVHALVTLPLLLKLVARVNPLRHYRAVAPAILMAFSTASSSATLPLTMQRVNENAGVSKRVTSFTLPLGATVNMDGTALYECVAAIFIAQAYGVQLTATQQFTVVVVALLTSIGVAGIPSASLVAITLILNTVGLPLEAVGLILAVDRILDMCRTAVNVLSDSTAAVVIARLEGESVLQAVRAASQSDSEPSSKSVPS